MTFGQSSPQDGWQINYKQALASQGINTYFIPAFSDSSTPPSNMYEAFPVVDGHMSWDSSWPWASDGKANVSCDIDEQYLAAAKEAKKTYMMRKYPADLSSLAISHRFMQQCPVSSSSTSIPLKTGTAVVNSPLLNEFLKSSLCNPASSKYKHGTMRENLPTLEISGLMLLLVRLVMHTRTTSIIPAGKLFSHPSSLPTKLVRRIRAL